MNHILAGTLAAAALVIGASVLTPGSTDRQPKMSDPRQLLDPSRLNAGLCGGDQARDNRLSRLVALFAVPAAQAAIQPGDGPPLYDNLGSFSMKVTPPRHRRRPISTRACG